MIDDNALEAAIAAAGIAGAVAHVAGPEGVRYARAFGVTDATSGTTVREDSIFQIASMTKAVVSAAAMQMVERGQLALDAPVGDLLPGLSDPQVIAGFDDAGAVQLRPAKRAITLRHLLTHTSGLGYDFVHPEILQSRGPDGPPAPGTLATIQMPLLFDPGERWEYGVGIDWAGRLIEAASRRSLGDHLASELLEPLGMAKTAFRPEAAWPVDAAQVHMRMPDGSIAPYPMFLGGGAFQMGGAGLSSTASDYARFLRMVLNGGELDGVRVLAPETVARMTSNQIGTIRAGAIGTAMPQLSPAYDPFPDQHSGWSLGGFLINPETGPNGRSAGSLCWAGIFNSYYWADPATGITGIMMAQLLPYADERVLAAYGALERMAYGRA